MKAFQMIAVLASLAVSSLALADEPGAGGTVSELEINTTAGDTYLQYHGRMVVVTTVGKNNSTSTEYRWGGTSCGSRTLSESQMTMLQRALESGTPIVPRYQIGQGMSKCLVGFKLAA